jgi:hypothetical protein
MVENVMWVWASIRPGINVRPPFWFGCNCVGRTENPRNDIGIVGQTLAAQSFELIRTIKKFF